MQPIQICKVDLATVVPVRMKELDPPRSWEDALSAGDLLPDSAHFAAFHDGRLVGVASVGPEALPIAPDIPAWRFRGLAVVSGCRKQGIGSLLVKAQFDHAAQHATKAAWLYAKDRLSTYYTARGFVVTNHTHLHPNGGLVRLFLNREALCSLDRKAQVELLAASQTGTDRAAHP